MLFPLSTPIIDNPTNLALWGGSGTSNILLSYSGGYLNANAISPNYDVGSYVYVLNSPINIRDLTFSFVYKKIDTNNSEIEIGYKSISMVEYSAYLNVKNIGDLTTFTINRRGGIVSSTLALSSIVALNEEVQVNVRMYDGKAEVNIVRSDGKSITKSISGIDFNTAVFALSPVLGNHSIKNLKVYSQYTSRPYIKFLGDSITALPNSRADVCGRCFTSYVKTAGGGDRSQEILSALTTNNNFIPTVSILMVGRNNDLSTKSLRDTYQSNLLDIYNRLLLKSPVYVHEVLPTTTDTAILHSQLIYEIIPVSNIIPSRVVLKNTGNDFINPIYTDDGVHPNALGANKLGKFEADFIRAKGY